jgi:trimeric autotransporter adhesin
MSTKTTFKRIALVAVAALGLGVLTSVAPASAARPTNAADGFLPIVSFASGPVTGTVGAEYTAIVKSTVIGNEYGASKRYAAFISYATAGNDPYNEPAFSALTSAQAATYTSSTGVSVDTGNDSANSYWNYADFVVADANMPAANATARYNGHAQLKFTPSAAGSYTLTVVALDRSVSGGNTVWTPSTTNTASVTVVVTAPAVASATAFINTTVGSEATADTAAASRTASSAASATPVARFTVKQYSTTDTTTAIISGYASAVTATVAGAGILGAANDGSNRSSLGVSVSALGTGVNDFYLYADGRTGVSTVTITAGTTVITKTFTFYGTLSTYARDEDDLPKTHIGITETDVMNIVGKDATGNLTASAGTIYAISSDATVASVSVSSQAVTVTGVKSGTATITICDTPLCVSAVKKITVPVAVAKTTAASFTLAFDKAEYTPGEKMTITVKAVDSNGAGVADGSRNLFSATGITSNASLTGASWTATAAVALVAGVKTYTVYAPLVPGTVSIMATQGTAVDAVALGGTAAVISASAVVVSDGVAQAAADAAAEATDAANAATDAANAAAEAADAATAAAQDAADAVAALSTSVTAMVDALKKQITALTNLVIKIQKKVKA